MASARRPRHQLLYDDPMIPMSRQKATQRIVPVTLDQQRNGPWSGNNQLGITQPFQPAANNRQTILKLDEWGPPEVWTVSLGIDYTDVAFTAAGSGHFEVVADVDIGVGGAQQNFQVDWNNGATFSACMNAINVIAEYSADTINFIVPGDLRLTVMLAKKPIVGYPPTVGAHQAFAPATAGPLIRIPPFTQRISIQSDDVDPAHDLFSVANRVEQHGHPDGLWVASQLRADRMLLYPEGWPVSRTAKYVRYVNNEAGYGILIKWVFGLTL